MLHNWRVSRKELGAKREAAIVALLTTRGVEEAARSVGIAPTTLFRWLKDPDFNVAYRAAKRAAFGQSIACLHHLTSAAVSTLGKVMLDPGRRRRSKLERLPAFWTTQPRQSKLRISKRG